MSKRKPIIRFALPRLNRTDDLRDVLHALQMPLQRVCHRVVLEERETLDGVVSPRENGDGQGGSEEPLA